MKWFLLHPLVKLQVYSMHCCVFVVKLSGGICSTLQLLQGDQNVSFLTVLTNALQAAMCEKYLCHNKSWKCNVSHDELIFLPEFIAVYWAMQIKYNQFCVLPRNLLEEYQVENGWNYAIKKKWNFTAQTTNLTDSSLNTFCCNQKGHFMCQTLKWRHIWSCTRRKPIVCHFLNISSKAPSHFG